MIVKLHLQIDLSIAILLYCRSRIFDRELIAESITQSDSLEQTWISSPPRNYCDHIWCKTPFQAHMAMLTR